MAIPQLTPFPDPPRIYQPEEEFDAKADEMAGHLPVLVDEINAMVAGSNAAWADINTKTTTATTAATTATNAAVVAGTSASNAELFKQAAASSATNAASSATAATTAKNAAETSATNAANSATAAETSATYAKNRIDHVITQAGLTVNTSDVAQLQEAIVQAGKLLGGNAFGASGCIFIGGAVVSGSAYYVQRGDFSKISKHASFAGAGYLHLKLHGGSIYSMPRIAISGYEYGSNNYINEIASAYLYGPSGVYQQKNTAGANTPFFYYSSTQGAFMLRIKITSAEYLVIRLEAMDSRNQNPLSNLVVNSGMLTPLTVETI